MVLPNSALKPAKTAAPKLQLVTVPQYRETILTKMLPSGVKSYIRNLSHSEIEAMAVGLKVATVFHTLAWITFITIH